jgi:chromosome segregation ATPase
MPQEFNQEPDYDLDKTDKLPVLNLAGADLDVTVDAAPLVHPATDSTIKTAFARPAHFDQPLFAETVRTVEERIERHNADYQALSHAYERSMDTEAAAAARANALAAELLELRAKLEAEQSRADELGQTVAASTTAVQLARARIEDLARETERQQEETRSLREALATRDATIVQALHSLAQRDAQLTALQRDHVTAASALEAKSRTSELLETDLRSALARIDALQLELKGGAEATGALSAEIQRFQAKLDATLHELRMTKTQSASYLEQLQTREWRNGFDQNLFREMDTAAGAAQAQADALQSERDALNKKIANLSQDLTEREDANAKLQAIVAANADELNRYAVTQQKSELDRAELTSQVAATEAEKQRVMDLLSMKDTELEESRAAANAERQRISGQLEASERRNAEESAKILELQADVEVAQQETTVLFAHLQEVRRPIAEIEAEVRRLTDELAQTSAHLTEIDDENRELKDSLERARGALQEREFLIRRLERSESINASALGRIQTSIERLAAPSVPTLTADALATSPLTEVSASLERLDETGKVPYPLGQRTLIGRAIGCDMQIDCSSVSRHHAVIVLSPRGAIIEDSKSTNGVIVNGSVVTRQFLRDGDTVEIGEAKFRFRTNQPTP